MNKGAGPTRARIEPDPMNKPVPIAPPRALCDHQQQSHYKTKSFENVQELDMSALQPAVRVAATPRLATNSGSAMDKRLLKRTVLFLIPIGYTMVAFFGIPSIGNVVVGHDVRVGRVLQVECKQQAVGDCVCHALSKSPILGETLDTYLHVHYLAV